MSKIIIRKRVSSQPNTAQNILKNFGYSLGECIGQGTYSKVCLVVGQSGEKAACKIINKRIAGSEFIKKFLPRELQIISKIQHPHIVNVFKILEIHSVIYILMDFCKNGDLLEYIRANGCLPENNAKHYFRQIVSALEYLHDLNIAHRDMKCENVLITAANTIKLGDFGFARSCIDIFTGYSVLSETFCGSAAYAAPEILQGIPYDPKMFDIWALGCVLYIMLTATMPFDDTNVKRMIKKQLNRSLFTSEHKKWNKHSHALKNLLVALLEPNVHKRATIKQVSNCIWLQEPSLQNYKEFIISLTNENII